jgi:putative membrane protein
MRLLINWLINAAALLAVAYLYTGVQVKGFVAALIAALVLGLINALIRPLLVVLTLPVTVLTLGLFLFVVNAACFWLAAQVIPGFAVSGFWAALIGSLLFSIITTVAGWLLSPAKGGKR